MRRRVMVLVGLSVALAGCATLDRGAEDKFYVASEPPGATVTLSDGETCTTPCGLAVPRRESFTATIAKAGFETQVVNVATRLTATGVGDLGENVVTGGAGAIVDVATGAALEHVPNPLKVTLKPIGRAPVARAVRPRVG